MIAASLMLLLLFVFPMWQITLLAPQYPNGLTMNLWIYKITGDIAAMNILNHYIGMAKITASEFKEFVYFPYVVVFLSLTGLVAAFSKKRSLILIWVIVVIVLGIAGIYDFYLWEYRYGHNLNPNAPIKITGMAYQPPLFGRKELLNFIAYSYPAFGGIAIGISIGLAGIAWILSIIKK